MTCKRLGQFDFDFQGGGQKSHKLSEAIVSARWKSQLDRSDTLNVIFALSLKDSKQLNFNDFPSRLKVAWQERQIFTGGLLGLRSNSLCEIELIYRDELYKLKRIVDGSHLKRESLGNELKIIASKAKLDAKLLGDFSDVLPSIFLGGRSLFENLEFLSEQFGFFFYFHGPSGLLHFMRLGSSQSKVRVDLRKKAYQVHSSFRSDLSWSDVETRVFDDRDLSTQSKSLNTQSLYSSLSSMTDHGGYRSKQSWPFAEGRYQVHAQNSNEFEDSDRRVKNPLAKKASFQEQLTLYCLDPVALPGDEVETQNAWQADLSTGKYLAHSAEVLFNSALPKLTLSLIRP